MSYIKQFWSEEKQEYVHKGLAFDSSEVEDLIQTSILGFCGCGVPMDSLAVVRDGLELIQTKHLNSPDSSSSPLWKPHYDEWRRKCDVVFPDPRSFWFFMYWAETQDMEEHGGSTPGWLTEKGEGLLADLNELLGPTQWEWEVVVVNYFAENNNAYRSAMGKCDELRPLFEKGKVPPHHPKHVAIVKELLRTDVLDSGDARIDVIKSPLYGFVDLNLGRHVIDGRRLTWDAREF